MSERLQTITNALEKIAPRALAESWDNVGLQIGHPNQGVNRIMAVLDITDENVRWAIDNKIDLIIAHHPLILKPISHIRSDMAQGALLSNLIKNNIAVFILHTNIDMANGGLNDSLAEKLGLVNVEILKISNEEKLYKIVTFVPKTHYEQVFKIMMSKGAGHIGNYSHCAFQCDGKGSFLPLENSQPFIGTNGRLEVVEEVRLETIVGEKHLNKVVNAMIKAHPYEEVAYDVYTLNNKGVKSGLGRKGLLQNKVSLHDFACHVKEKLSVLTVGVIGSYDKTISKVAVCGGSGSSLINDAYFAGLDVLVTGDVKYHEAQMATALGIAVVDAGHFATEIHIAEFLAKYLKLRIKVEKWKIQESDIMVGVNNDYFQYI